MSKKVNEANELLKEKKSLVKEHTIKFHLIKNELELQRSISSKCIQSVHNSDMDLAIALQRNKGLLERKKGLENDLSRLFLEEKNQNKEFSEVSVKLVSNNDDLLKNSSKLIKMQELLNESRDKFL